MSETNRIIEGLRLVVNQRADAARRVMMRGVAGLPAFGEENDKLADLLDGYADAIKAATAEYRAAGAELLMHEVVEESHAKSEGRSKRRSTVRRQRNGGGR